MISLLDINNIQIFVLLKCTNSEQSYPYAGFDPNPKEQRSGVIIATYTGGMSIVITVVVVIIAVNH